MFEYYWIDLKEAARKANNARDLDLSYTNVKGPEQRHSWAQRSFASSSSRR